LEDVKGYENLLINFKINPQKIERNMNLITIFAIEKLNNGRSSIQNTDITLAAKELSTFRNYCQAIYQCNVLFHHKDAACNKNYRIEKTKLVA
jgi:ABC-type polar amino acid transport system ATPase subunit